MDTVIDQCGGLLDECKVSSPKPKSYRLLRKYEQTARVSSIAHKSAERYYRHMNRALLLTLMAVTTTGSIIISIPWVDKEHLMSKIISYIAMLISGTIAILKPGEKFTQHNAIATEYSDIASDIEQILASNNLTREEIADANHLYLSKIQIFDSQAPPLNSAFISSARNQISLIPRIDSSIKKKSHRAP